ncbi:MAG TPA: fatty acid desaturase [Rhizomicrobium sp.]
MAAMAGNRVVQIVGHCRFGSWHRRQSQEKGQFVNQRAAWGSNASIPARLNMVLAGAFLGIGLFQLLAVPAILAHSSIWWAFLLIPCALSTTTYWSLIHEAIHRLLAPNERLNDLCGRALAVIFGSPFELLRFPHLLHHHINGRVADRPDYYRTDLLSRGEARLRYYPNLLLGIYAAELAGTFLCLMPRSLLRSVMRRLPKAHDDDDRAEVYLLKPERLSQLRFDACAAMALYTFAFWWYGVFWPLFVLSMLARGVLLSVADNSYHYGAPLGAGPRSSYNLKFPFGVGILNFNLHRVHHVHPNLPWSGLPGAFEIEGEAYDVGYVSAMLRQFQGPISHTEYSSFSPSNLSSRQV